MNIQYLQQLLSGIDEIKILGKTTEINGVIYHIMGIIRYECQLRLLVLQYDEDFISYEEEHKINEMEDLSKKALSNGQHLYGRCEKEAVSKIQHLREIKIGATLFEVAGIESGRCDVHNWESLLLITEFLRHGWHPDGIDYQNMDNLYLVFAELAGEFAVIPDFGENPHLQIKFHDKHAVYLAEQSVKISVGAEYPDKLWFSDKNTGELHWLQINRVYLYDMWAEILNSFNDPHLQEQLSPEELEKSKADFEKTFLEICPRDMYFPIIEYECEEDITPEFHLKAWLDAEPVHNNSASGIGFIVKPDKKTGVLGLELKTTLIHEPVPADTKSIETELCLFNKLEKLNDIFL